MLKIQQKTQLVISIAAHTCPEVLPQMEEGADRPLRSRTDPGRMLTLLSMILNQKKAVTVPAGAVPSLYALSSTHLSVICIFW